MAQTINPYVGAGLGATQGALSAFGGAGVGGMAAMNPYSAAAMAAGQIGSALLGGPDPSNTSGNNAFNAFTVDNSGWSVNFGSGSASATANPVSNLATGLANAVSGGGSQGIGITGNPLILILMGVALIVVLRK